MSHQNLMIEAGAGTGKTTRLVKAVLEALFVRQIKLESVVALTFTNKAAGELKDRVAQALNDVIIAPSLDALCRKPWWPSDNVTLSLTDLQTSASAGLTVLDRANISTIHSFAFALLKRFPLAAGIAPDAEIDDKGLRFDELFRREWPRWLSVELGHEPPRELKWLELLARVSLPTLEKTARQLADFSVPLSKLPISDREMAQTLRPFYDRCRLLATEHRKSEIADRIIQACEEVIGRALASTPSELLPLSSVTSDDVTKSLPTKTASWSDADYRQLKVMHTVARNLLSGGDRLIALATELLTPFIKHFRETLLSEGCLTHSALLYLSRDMVRDHADIREALKKTFRMLLIDEFQDTDPLQGELLVYLAEALTGQADDVASVRLEAGKLFVVGDPKQSIYRFRGADIAAYEHIGEMIVRQGGRRETLETNYRSQAQIIDLVNAAFHRIIQEEPEISPAYRAVEPHHAYDKTRPLHDVQLWLASAPAAQSAEDAQITEAENAAQWIKASVGHLEVHDPREGPRPLLYRDVALIFRSYSPMDPFIDAFRRHSIPFAVESERYFFTTPEVTDMLNILHAADNPADYLSLTGVLRGPLGGHSDEEILRRKNEGSWETWETVQWIRHLGDRLKREPLADVLDSVFNDTFLVELAARSYHGDQTIANLLKLRRLLETFSSEGTLTMGLLLERLEQFFADDKIEGESPLADENYNAVRLLTVHKSKGLEFPVVFLPSLHSEVRPHPGEPFLYDWRTQKVGLSIVDSSGVALSNLDKIELDDQTQKREAAEENRILYVAMTRARECLILSGGTHLKVTRSRTYLNRLLAAWDQVLDALPDGPVTIGRQHLTVRHLQPVTRRHDSAAADGDNPLGRIDLDAFASAWEKRIESKRVILGTPRLVTPSALKGRSVGVRTAHESNEGEPAASRTQLTPTVLGSLVHKILEEWDFSVKPSGIDEKITSTTTAYFANTDLPPALMTEGIVIDAIQTASALIRPFLDSDDYQELRRSEILGRELPFVYSVGSQTLMRGTIDVVYRRPDGTLVIGDYKTDREPETNALAYDAQGQAYVEALKRALGEKAQFKLIFLRPKT